MVISWIFIEGMAKRNWYYIRYEVSVGKSEERAWGNRSYKYLLVSQMKTQVDRLVSLELSGEVQVRGKRKNRKSSMHCGIYIYETR